MSKQHTTISIKKKLGVVDCCLSFKKKILGMLECFLLWARCAAYFSSPHATNPYFHNDYLIFIYLFYK
jgi:hypothetical protein